MRRRGLWGVGWTLMAAGCAVAAAGEPGVDRGARRDDGVVAQALRDELARTMSELRLGDEPAPYYVAYTVSDVDQSSVGATRGALTAAHRYGGRFLRTDVRVGDRKFDNTNFIDASSFGSARGVESLPVDDDYGALRRELWLRSDESYKSAVEALAHKRAAASNQSDDEEDRVADFSEERPVQVTAASASVPEAASPDALRPVVARLSAVVGDVPAIYSSHATATFAVVRRRFASSEGTFVDERRATLRLDVTAETQAADGMKLRNYVSFSALSPDGLPPLAEMEQAVRRMADELVAMRGAPVGENGSGSVLFEGPAAAQILRMLMSDQLSGTPPPRTSGSEAMSRGTEFASKLGLKVAAPIVSVWDDPLQEVGPGKSALFGAYRVDDEGVPAARVSLIENGILKTLLMSRSPRKEISRSNGHARGPRFGSPRAAVGSLFVELKRTLARPVLLGEMERAARGSSMGSYVVRLLDDGSVPSSDPDEMMAMLSIGMGDRGGAEPVRPLVIYRIGKDHKEHLVRGVTLEGLLARSLKDIVAGGKEPVVYNYLAAGSGFSGVPTSIVTPALLFSDVDVRRHTGKNRRPPLYPAPERAPAR